MRFISAPWIAICLASRTTRSDCDFVITHTFQKCSTISPLVATGISVRENFPVNQRISPLNMVGILHEKP